MKTKRHIILYVTSCIWNLTACWPVVLLIRLFWGENLRWEAPPDAKESGAGPGLWCDLKPDSWPTRSWYRMKVDSEVRELPEVLRKVWGRWHTWGATTLGHGGFYGPGKSKMLVWEGGDPKLVEAWVTTEEHENVHVEQFEASMLRALMVATVYAIVFLALGHPITALVTFLVHWWLGYWLMGGANWLTAWLRGEDPYRGSHHEEGAYDRGEEYKREQREKADA